MEPNAVLPNAPEHPVDRAAKIVGGRALLAEKLTVSVAAIGNWKVRGVPVEKCPLIEKLTNGAVRCEELSSDVDWQYLRESGSKVSTSFTQVARVERVMPEIASKKPHGEPMQQGA